MEKVTCEYCNAIVSSKYILKTHLSTNKTCLSIRNLELKTNYMCEGCNLFTLDNQKLSNHHESCKSYQIILIKNELEKKYNEEIKQLNDKLIEKQIYHSEMKLNFEKTIKDLQIQNEKLIDSLQKLASQAIDKPTTTVTNIKNNFSDKYFLDAIATEDVKRKFQNYLTEELFFEGQRGIAQLCTEHIIKTKDNKSLMVCTDTSRKKFKYMDENGNMKEDFEARTFTDKVSKPIKDVSKIVYENILSDVKSEKELVEDTNYSRKAYLNDKELKTIDCFVKINCFDHPDHNMEFKNELAILNK